MAVFKLHQGSLQERFQNSRGKIQLFGGGFANGKTTNVCIKVLQVAKDYPGANILMARSTYPKLNDTLRKEFLKWCPPSWIKSFPKSANASNTCTFTNGTTINFRYIAQQGKSGESTTSNLLSATYDLVVVDQMEDPEIVHKDLLDLLGRLRGMATYDGTDPTMPKTGPRWVLLTTNPTRNWVYKKLVKPLHDLDRGIINQDLMCETDEDGVMLLDENKKPTPIIELYEGSTYENAANLEQDFIKTLEASYQGQMRTRFLMGEWASYEGLVYPQFNETIHTIPYHNMLQHLKILQMKSREVTYLEGYDYGLAVPYCYLCGFTDELGNVFIIDGGYEKEQPLDDHIGRIKECRTQYGISDQNFLYADPDIFRRKGAGKKTVGLAISDMFLQDGIVAVRGNNDISNGIIKVGQYLTPQQNHAHPVTKEMNSPYIYISEHLEWLINEFSAYYWRKTPTGDVMDKPMDKDDHAMDTIKYMLSHRPSVSKLIKAAHRPDVGWRKWGERDMPEATRNVRHG